MSLTLEQQCAQLCPHCLAGSPVVRRRDTGEWTHTLSVVNGGPWSHTLCWADGLRCGRLTFEQSQQQSAVWKGE